MTILDIIGVGFTVALLLVAGFYFSRRGGKSSAEFMLGGRKLPWWLAGTAMVAGNSNADSSLHQSGKIRRDGLPGAWFYWAQVVGQMFSSLVFSRLWRRTGVTSVAEFYEIRYAGRARVAGRVWAMVFTSFIEGTFGLALGLLALIKIGQTTFHLNEPVALLGLAVSPALLIALVVLGLAITYSVVSGLLGVVAGDAVEFIFALLCSYVLTFYVYRATGYGAGLEAGLARLGLEGKLSFLPALGFSAVVFFIVQPLASLAGSSGVNQRYLALRNEQQAMLSGVWRIINHYFLRCWPWYLCGLCSLVLLPGFDQEMAYPELILRYMPGGLRGFMFGTFLIAFMGTVSAAMHTSGTIFVNDFYRAYLVPHAHDHHYVWITRLAMLVFTVVGTVIALLSDQILSLLQVFLTVTSAAGLVLLLRWFWWRVNGWADLSAQLLALPVTLFFENSRKLLAPEHDPVAIGLRLVGGTTPDDRFAVTFVLTVATTTALWLLVMLLTPPEPMDKLQEFYRRVRPYGWWGLVARSCPDVKCTDSFLHDLWLYSLGLCLALSLLFGLGLVLLGRFGVGGLLLLAGGLAGYALVTAINGRHDESTSK